MSDEQKTTREKIIEAAVRLIAEEGTAHFTLEAVADYADVSKGGLLYHFASKDALIEAMIQHYLDACDERVQELLQGDGRPHAWLRAFVRMTFEDQPTDIAIVASKSAAFVNNPDLIAPLRTRYQQWMRQATADGLPVDVATLVIAASDGYWYAKMFEFNDFDDEARQGLLDRLLQMIEDT
ncbi:MAG: TetR/AcrR family transcriptional regulator [Anaerolineaceae bacterium]|nr:MAG: TetR/AcrR family transcriptional regulator [Anaerolineaceae bacterium]